MFAFRGATYAVLKSITANFMSVARAMFWGNASLAGGIKPCTFASFGFNRYEEIVCEAQVQDSFAT